jgi:hypothetical protein
MAKSLDQNMAAYSSAMLPAPRRKDKSFSCEKPLLSIILSTKNLQLLNPFAIRKFLPIAASAPTACRKLPYLSRLSSPLPPTRERAAIADLIESSKKC